MKKTLSIILALILSVSMAIPVYALENHPGTEISKIEASAGSEAETPAPDNETGSGSEIPVPESETGSGPETPIPENDTESEPETATPSDQDSPDAVNENGEEVENDLKETPENDLTNFTIGFDGELKDVILQVRYFDKTAEEWKDYPGGTFNLEEATLSIAVNDYDMSLYGSKVSFVISDPAGTFSKAAAEAELPAETIVIPVRNLFSLDFTAETKDLLSNGFVYTGEAITPDISITSGLTEPDAIDERYYSVSFSDDFTNVGTVTVNVAPEIPFMSGCTGTFSIRAFDLAAGETTVKIDDVLYTGGYVKPDPVVKTVLSGKTVTLTKGTDYTVSYADNKKIGTATATIKGKGNFTGSVTQTFQILDNTITYAKLKYATLNYNGKPRTQSATTVVKWGKKVLTANTDYKISYKNNVNIGTATMIIKGVGAYRGTIEKTFKIVLPVSKLTVSGIVKKEYTGKAIRQNVVVKYGDKTLVKGTDYKITYENNIEAGRASVIITGKGYYKGTLTKHFKITKPLSKLTIGGIKNRVYTGKAITLKITVKDGDKKLVKDTDYTVAYTNNVGPGKATVTIRGKGFYTGKVKKTFMIRKKVDELKISGIKNVTYNGKAQTFDIVVKDGSKVLVRNTDYRVSYANNKNAGTGTVTIKGRGNYTGSVKKSFEIRKARITALNLKYDSMEYNGSKRTQTNTAVVKSGKMVLTKGTDFTVRYTNNIEPGTATMTVTGKGNFTGTVSKSYTITKYKLKKKDVVLSYTSKPYNGKAYKPAVTVTVHYKGGKKEVLPYTKYKVTYKNNKNAGTAKVIVEALGDHHTGKITKTFKITHVRIKTVTLSQSEYTYDGTPKKPSVTVKAVVDGKTVTLKEKTDYTLVYKNNVKAGTATASVTGKGNFKGTLNANYKIKQARLSALIVSGDSFTYTGSAICPEVKVTSGAKTLVKGTDYIISYTGNVNVGTATITVSGTGNYTGVLTKKYTINPRPLTKVTVYLDTDSVMKNKNNQLYPTVTSVVVNGRKLTEGVDYTVVNPQIGNYDKPYEFVGYININAKGNYTGSVKKKMIAMSDSYFIPKDLYGKDIRTVSYRQGTEPLYELFYNSGSKGRYYVGGNKDFTAVYYRSGAANTMNVRVVGVSKALRGLNKVYSFKVY